jgi:hypothetical protein
MNYTEYRQQQVKEQETADKKDAFQMKWGCTTIVVGIVVALILGFAVSPNAGFICIPIVLLIELMINDF